MCPDSSPCTPALKRIAVMRKRRLFLAVGACLATVALALGAGGATPWPDPAPPTPPPGRYRPVVGAGAKTTKNLLNDLCNNIIKAASNNRIAQSWTTDLSRALSRPELAQASARSP